jgi:hypothetical protein
VFIKHKNSFFFQNLTLKSLHLKGLQGLINSFLSFFLCSLPSVVNLPKWEGYKKSNDEGIDFYYTGDVHPINDSFEQTTLPTEDGKSVSVVQLVFRLNHPVEDHLYEYLTESNL